MCLFNDHRLISKCHWLKIFHFIFIIIQFWNLTCSQVSIPQQRWSMLLKWRKDAIHFCYIYGKTKKIIPRLDWNVKPVNKRNKLRFIYFEKRKKKKSLCGFNYFLKLVMFFLLAYHSSHLYKLPTITVSLQFTRFFKTKA